MCRIFLLYSYLTSKESVVNNTLLKRMQFRNPYGYSENSKKNSASPKLLLHRIKPKQLQQ